LRHSTAAIEMRKVLANPSFGNPVAMELRYFASKPKGKRWGLSTSLRSFLLSHVNHAIDFMIYQLGAIEKVNASLSAWRGDELALTTQFVFTSGAVGTLIATSFAPHFLISGTIISDMNRVIQMNSLDKVVSFGQEGNAKRWGNCWTTKTLLTGYETSGYLTELQEFVNAVRAREPESFHPSFSDELDVYDAIDAIERAIIQS